MQEIKKGVYRHYKGPKYRVLDIVRHSEDDSFLVLYKTMYQQQDGRDDLWVRPVDMFLNDVSSEDGKVKRFTYLHD